MICRRVPRMVRAQGRGMSRDCLPEKPYMQANLGRLGPRRSVNTFATGLKFRTPLGKAPSGLSLLRSDSAGIFCAFHLADTLGVATGGVETTRSFRNQELAFIVLELPVAQRPLPDSGSSGCQRSLHTFEVGVGQMDAVADTIQNAHEYRPVRRATALLSKVSVSETKEFVAAPMASPCRRS